MVQNSRSGETVSNTNSITEALATLRKDYIK